MSKVIKVKSCGECPFAFTDEYEMEFCKLDKTIKECFLPQYEIHENCPLKKESVTVKVKEE